MATDWVKMRSDLYRDNKVSAMADHLLDTTNALAAYVSHLQGSDLCVTRNVMRNAVVGALVSVWGLSRHQGKRVGDDLSIPSASLSSIDDMADMEGFASAMVRVGWLVNSSQGLCMPNFFAEYNSDPNEAAKEKNRERQKRYRDKNRNAESNVSVTLRNGTEKRREREELKPTPKSSPKNSGSGVGGILTNLKAEDLKNLDKLNQIADSIPRFRSEHGRLVIVAAALRAMDNAKTSPGGMFRTLVETDPGKLGELVEPYMQDASHRMRAHQKPRNSPQTHAVALAEAFAVPKQGNTS